VHSQPTQRFPEGEMEIGDYIIAFRRRGQLAWLLRRKRCYGREQDSQKRKPAASNIVAHRGVSSSNGILANQLCRSMITDFTTTSLFGLS
jgi:hypothetical protein